MAGSNEKVNLLSRAVEWLANIALNYLPELVIVVIVLAAAEFLLKLFGTFGPGEFAGHEFTAYEFIIMTMMLILLFIACATMLNTARTRVSDAELLEELRKGGDDGGESTTPP